MLDIILQLQKRYTEMSKGSSSEARIVNMMEAMVSNYELWPLDKLNRWLGYAQCILIEVEGVTSVQSERDFTRPLFHAYYAKNNIEIPESFKVAE